MKKFKPQKLEHPILSEFRLNGRWVHPDEKTIMLLPSQAVFLIQNGKVGQPIVAKSSTKTTEKEGK